MTVLCGSCVASHRFIPNARKAEIEKNNHLHRKGSAWLSISFFSSILNEYLQLNHFPGEMHPSLTCWGLTSVYFSSQQVHWLTVPKAGVPILLFCAYLIFPGALSGPNGLPVLASSLLTRVWVTVFDDGPITKLHGF